jgi:hypothetical protein
LKIVVRIPGKKTVDYLPTSYIEEMTFWWKKNIIFWRKFDLFRENRLQKIGYFLSTGWEKSWKIREKNKLLSQKYYCLWHSRPRAICSCIYLNFEIFDQGWLFWWGRP